MTKPEYRLGIYDENLREVQTILADMIKVEGSVIRFYIGSSLSLMYNLPPGYSMTSELAEDA